jgi:tetratricopeptide (TPR) repeat protein
MGRYRAAQTEYETALERSPNRFNSLYGAGLAAELGGSKREAVFYYKKILEITENVKTDRERLKHVKFYLSQTVGSS